MAQGLFLLQFWISQEPPKPTFSWTVPARHRCCRRCQPRCPSRSQSFLTTGESSLPALWAPLGGCGFSWSPQRAFHRHEWQCREFFLSFQDGTSLLCIPIFVYNGNHFKNKTTWNLYTCVMCMCTCVYVWMYVEIKYKEENFKLLGIPPRDHQLNL